MFNKTPKGMDTITMSRDDLNAAIAAAVTAAMSAYEMRQKEDVLIPRLRVMKLLHKSASTLWRWEKTSYLRPIRQGSSVMYHSVDLERLGVKFD